MTDTLPEREFEFTQADFKRVCELIRAHAGIALAASKHEMVYTRLVRRLRALSVARFSDYLDRLERDDGEEWEHFTNALTTNLTSFFREPHHFPILSRLLKSLHRNRPLRIWCAAASTGEEPWSLAICACETFDTLSPPVQILASDVDTNVLATAKAGVYDMERVTHLPQSQLQRFFQRGTGENSGLVRMHPKLHELMSFRAINLLDSHYGLSAPFDAIFCRNVMIYFDKPTQYRVLQNLMPLLEPDGLLFAGHSESFFHAADIVRLREHTVYERIMAPGSLKK
ncbi:MAG: chemotaxis protein methyltransferase [Pseudomonadota bacterium]|jgi:chemotaxis protein methyltransferase CheR